MSPSIFERNIGGNICYIRSTADRVSVVGKCSDKKALFKELDSPDIQVTVMKAILKRIKRLERGE